MQLKKSAFLTSSQVMLILLVHTLRTTDIAVKIVLHSITL